jgi:tetratricopeptide (TPR) repeat protein
VRVQTGKEFKNNALVDLTASERLQAYQDLEASGGHWHSRPLDARPWHLFQAAQAEVEKNWYAARFHLNRLLEVDPDRLDLVSRRAAAQVELKQWEDGIADANRVLARTPNDVPSLRTRADCYSGLNQWRPALADWEKASQLKPDDSLVAHRLGLAYLGNGDVDAYRRQCRQMVDRFENTRDSGAAANVAFLALVLPDADPEVSSLVRLAELSHQAPPHRVDSLETLGAALYRANRYAEAVQRLDEAVWMEKKGGTVWMQLFLAMAHHRLGQQTAAPHALGQLAVQPGGLVPALPGLVAHDLIARNCLALAVEKMEQTKDPSWQDKIRWPLLRREAEALLNSPER